MPLLYLTFSLAHYRNALEEPTVLHSSVIWWSTQTLSPVSFCAPAIRTRSHKKSRTILSKFSRPLKYLMPF